MGEAHYLLDKHIVVVTGGRDFEDHMLVWKFVELFARGVPCEVYVGDCPRGVDLFVRECCEELGYLHRVFTADWEAHGKWAGPKRNLEMVTAAGKGAILLAFPGGRGTKDCISKAKHAGLIPVLVGKHEH